MDVSVEKTVIYRLALTKAEANWLLEQMEFVTESIKLVTAHAVLIRDACRWINKFDWPCPECSNTSLVLELDETQAMWLKGCVQNPIHENEYKLDSDMRLAFWNALGGNPTVAQSVYPAAACDDNIQY